MKKEKGSGYRITRGYLNLKPYLATCKLLSRYSVTWQ